MLVGWLAGFLPSTTFKSNKWLLFDSSVPHLPFLEKFLNKSDSSQKLTKREGIPN